MHWTRPCRGKAKLAARLAELGEPPRAEANPYSQLHVASPWRQVEAEYKGVLASLWSTAGKDSAAVLRINVYDLWRAASASMPLLARAARRLLGQCWHPAWGHVRGV